MTYAVPRHRKRIATATTLTAVAAFVTASIALAAPSNADSGATTTLPGTTPGYATASADLGQTGAAAPLSLRVYLAGQDPAGLEAYARAVSDPNSASYKHFLSTTEVRNRFGASQAQIDAVSQWLKAAGLTVTGSNQHWIDITGTVAAAQKAFGTQLHNFATPDGTLRSNSSDVKVPASIAKALLGVSGLAQSTKHAVTNHQKVDTSARGPVQNNDPSCSDYYGQKQVPASAPAVPAGFTTPATLAQCSLVPSEMRDAYGVSKSGLTGKGATIAIVNWYGSSTMEADANKFATNHGDKPFAKGQYSEVSDPSQWTNKDICGFGDFGEEALDVEMAHGFAPDAKVITIAANSCFDSDLIAAETNIVDNHLADVVSNSWGEIMYSTSGDIDPAQMKAYDQVFMQGAVEGIAFDFSSGDCMNNDAFSISQGLNCDPTASRAQVDWPASSAWVTSVGGTALGLDKRGYGFEAPMADTRSGRTAPGAAAWAPGAQTFGGGGGVSETIAQPWYQSWTVPHGMATTLMDGTKVAQPKRTIPDISLNGDLYFSSSLVGQTDPDTGVYSEGGFGGTSVSAPSWAGVLADAQQAQWGIPVGFANPAIYARSWLANDVVQNPRQITGSAIHSVVFQYPAGNQFAGMYRLIQYGVDEGLPASRGYDLATGVGSPNALFLRSFGFGR
ncbi:MAG: S8/S53 family peptidase [Catenulisporales bacterium]|nr:S8/S53 family peptidase [Catenulisporales bacterium]